MRLTLGWIAIVALAIVAAAGCKPVSNASNEDARWVTVDTGSPVDTGVGSANVGQFDAGPPRECRANEDCAKVNNGATPWCHSGIGKCVECRFDDDCNPSSPADVNKCVNFVCDVGPQCRASGGKCRMGTPTVPCPSGGFVTQEDCPTGFYCCNGGPGNDGGSSDAGGGDCLSTGGYCIADGDACDRDSAAVSLTCPLTGYFCCMRNTGADGGSAPLCVDKGGYCLEDGNLCDSTFIRVNLFCPAGRSCCMPRDADAGTAFDAGVG